MSTTIDHVGRSDTGTPARLPDDQGFAQRDGVRVHWESYGQDGPAILLLPAWSIVHSRVWKFQIPHLARRFRVITFDGRGNGESDRPDDPSAYANRQFVADAVAVLDAAGVGTACVVGLSMGGLTALRLATEHAERVAGVVLVDSNIPHLVPAIRDGVDFDAVLETYEGPQKFNRNYWLSDYPDFVSEFFSHVFPEAHSTKAKEDGLAWGLDTTARTLVMTQQPDGGISDWPTQAEAEALCAAVTQPALVIHGSDDMIVPVGMGERAAELIGAPFVRLEGSGHCPNLRDPVVVNRLIDAFADQVSAPPPRSGSWTRAAARTQRALYVSSPIGLGHAWRDVVIADELRRRVPGLEIHWLAQEPVTTVLRARGETIHPASAELASENEHIDREAGEHDLHAFQALRRMDEIFCANYMLFDDVVRESAYDLWIGDEAWEVDHYLHENPERKTAPYVWLTDFVGYLPMPAGGDREAALTADYNAEMIGHIERFPTVRDRSIFVGEALDVVDATFGPGLPAIRDWTQRHYEFAGYIPGFDPAALGDRAALRAELGYGDEPLLIVSVGGSGVGGAMLRRAIDALPALRERIPGLRTLAVTGPGIDPATVPATDGLEVRGYVHELYRHLAACDVGLVQGGLTTTMELVTARRPFVSLPLASHFEQRYHVRHRLDRYGARHWLEYGDAGPEAIAGAVAGALATEPSYRPVDFSGPARAADLIAEVLASR